MVTFTAGIELRFIGGEKVINLCLRVNEKVFLMMGGKGCWKEKVVNILREILIDIIYSHSEWGRGSCSR